MTLTQLVTHAFNALTRHPEELALAAIPLVGELRLVNTVEKYWSTSGNTHGNMEEGIPGREMNFGENFAAANLILGTLPRFSLATATALSILLPDFPLNQYAGMTGTVYALWTGYMALKAATYVERRSKMPQHESPAKPK